MDLLKKYLEEDGANIKGKLVDKKYEKALHQMNAAYSRFHNVYRKTLDTMISNRTEKTSSQTMKEVRDRIVEHATELDNALSQHIRMMGNR